MVVLVVLVVVLVVVVLVVVVLVVVVVVLVVVVLVVVLLVVLAEWAVHSHSAQPPRRRQHHLNSCFHAHTGTEMRRSKLPHWRTTTRCLGHHSGSTRLLHYHPSRSVFRLWFRTCGTGM